MQRIAAVLIFVGLVVFAAGVVNKHCACAGWPNLGETLNDVVSDFYANVTVDCLSIAFAILVLDQLNERRAERELKAQLIREMASKDNGIALRAVRELRARGWLTDGSLQKAELYNANLEGADLYNADLQGALLSGAKLENANLEKANLRMASLVVTNLQHAKLTGANLQGVELHGADLKKASLTEADLKDAIMFETELKGAFLDHTDLQGVKDVTDGQLAVATYYQHIIMPDGSHYDGRFHSLRDKMFDLLFELEDINPEDPGAMAHYYGITLQQYLLGQKWLRKNLARLRREVGLEAEDDALLSALLSAESASQPADAPAPPAPRRNGHKASMVTHRVRR